MAERTIETSVVAILKQSGFKIIEKSRSGGASLVTAKKGRLGGKKVAIAISMSDDLLVTLQKERDLHRKPGFKLKILFTLCETCEPSFGDIIIIKDPTELGQALMN